MGTPVVEDCDILLNATPTGMLDDQRLPIYGQAPAALACRLCHVMAKTTPLLALAEACGCVAVRGREMTPGQITRIVDFYGL